MKSLSPPLEDLLEHLYMSQVESSEHALPQLEPALSAELLRLGYISQQADAPLTASGRQAAELAVRRHRLAERLVHDVFNVHGQQVDASACEFEHSLHHGLDEKICILLGHPKTCPHGRPIPRGKCCKAKKLTASSVITELAIMQSGEQGVIAYLSSRHIETVQKLMALGVLPGSVISIIQTYPSIVFQVGQTQVAVDAALAGDIYVRRTE